MLELYHYGDSVCSVKVRLCLAEKGLQYESRFVDLLKFEHLRPEYLALNPNGVVPTLVHDGEPIVESTVINEYLEEVFPEPRLRPVDPVERARMRAWVTYGDLVMHGVVRDPTFSLMIKPVIAALDDAALRAIAARHPDPVRAERWLRTAREPVDQALLAEARLKLDKALERMERTLAKSPWLAGKAYSLADIAYASYVDRLEHLAMLDDAKSRPGVSAWIRRLKARPAYANAVPRDDLRMALAPMRP